MKKEHHHNETEGFLRTLLQHVLDVVAILDADGTIRYVNPAVQTMLGYSPEEVVGTEVFDYVHPDDLDSALEALAQTLTASGILPPLEFRARCADGAWRQVEVVRNNRLNDPRVLGVVINVRDVTERKQAEENLRFQGRLLDAAGEAVIASDVEGRVVYWNHCAEELYGWSAGETMGRNLTEMVVPETLRERAREIAREVRTGRAWSGEFLLRRKDGNLFTASMTNTPLSDDDGILVGVISVLRDVTERKEAEEARARFEAIVESSDYAIMSMTRTGMVDSWNPGAERLFGYTAEEIKGRHISILIPPERRGEIREALERLEQGRGIGFLETVRTTKSGKRVHVSLGLSPIYGSAGDVVGASAIVRDISKAKEAEERLREAEEKYRTLVERVPVINYIHHQEPGKFSGTTYASPQVETVLGYTQEEYTSDPEFWKTILHPGDRERVLLDDELTGETGGPFDLEFRMVAKDGRTVWLRESGALVRVEENGVQVWHGVMSDITELKRVEEELGEAEERYRTLVERIPAIVYTQEPDEPSRTTYVSPQNEAILGYTPEECLTDPDHWIKIMHPDDRERVLAEDARTNESGDTFVMEYRQYAKDGRLVWLRDEATLVRDSEGETLYWLGVQTDVTERKEAEEALRRSEASLAESQRIAHLGTWEWHVAKGEVWWSKETYRIHGLEPREGLALREKVGEAFLPEDLPVYEEKIAAALSGETEGYDYEHRIRRPDGELRWVHAQAEIVRGDMGEPLRMIGTVHDVTERKALEARLEHQAFHDPLTGLPNRQLLIDRLGQALRRTRRSQNRRAAVLFMDLDGFKVINDSLGHAVGDRLLVAVAERLVECLRPEDTLARFGGDEFVVLLEDAEGPDEAVRVAERIIDQLRGPFVLGGQELYTRPSVGIALGEDRTTGPDDLLRDADTAMYRAKGEGTGYAVFDPVMYWRAIDRLQAENDLKRAIEHEEFVVHYQPIVRLRTGEIATVEALVRWEHPERGLLDPSSFVSLAEESGLVIPMGEQILRESCLMLKGWQRKSTCVPNLNVSVNLSARQLSRPDFAETVEALLEKTGLVGSNLTLDVTETVYVEALEVNTRVLERLRSIGVKMSIDDFGMGYSSLSYLKRLPADALKIDKSFVVGLGKYAEDTTIVRMIIELAHTFGMEVIAEGVETEEQAIQLKGMGCDFGQGFHFSKPLPPGDLYKHLAR